MKERVLIAALGDEDTITGLLLAGIGHTTAKNTNYVVISATTPLSEVEDAFTGMVARKDVAIVLVVQNIADRIRGLVDGHVDAFPAVCMC